jgi:hypothetical protein
MDQLFKELLRVFFAEFIVLFYPVRTFRPGSCAWQTWWRRCRRTKASRS